MADGLKMEVIARDFSRMLDELASIDATVEFSQVVTSEAASVVDGAMRRTRNAEAGKIRADFAEKEWTTFGGKTYRLSWREPDAIYSKVSAQRQERLQTKLNARGIARQSWIHVASALGRSINAPAFVVAANYKTRQYPQDGAKLEEGGASAYVLTIINSSPIVQAAGGENALLVAMRGRVSYFQRNMESRAFRSIESRAKKYPGIFTSPVPTAIQ